MLYYKSFSDYGDNIFAKGLAKGLAEGRNQGLAEGRIDGRQAFMKACVSGRFGDRVAGAASPLLAGLVDPADLTGVNALLRDCSSGDEFLDRLKTMKHANGAV